MFKATDRNGLIYHSNSDDFPDCDDFADIARGQILAFAAKHGLSYAPSILFAAVLKGDSCHALLLMVDRNDKVWFYEPQNDTWSSKADEISFVREIQG